MIRVFNCTSGGKRLINLSFVSTIQIKDNVIKIWKSHERDSFGGNLFFLFGGGSNVEEITYATKIEAEKDFKEMGEEMQKYYSKS